MPSLFPKSADLLLFVIGVSLCFASACLSVFGVNLQKLIHLKNEAKPERERVPYYRQWKWWCAYLLVILGALFDFASLGFAPQMVVAAFGSFTLVINTWTAPLVLKETITKSELLATFLIFGGAFLAVVNAPLTRHSYGLDDLIDLLKTTQFVIYMAGVMCIGTVLVVTFHHANRLANFSSPAYSEHWRRASRHLPPKIF
eukprot:c15823_g1_i2.p1 GENE.c15823_g1_i2~~c15823_g1_i2.p1  ORF type:complete len:200 (+),score=22.53 c15823_g1_i2:42-641(+)